MATLDADVLILGAGVAGLSAARMLCEAGQRVIVLEGRHRVGGRLFTRHHSDHPLPIELGPEFVHGHMPDTFASLDDAGLIAYDVPDHHITTRNGKAVSQDAAWEKANAIVEKLSSVKDDLSFDDFLKKYAKGSPPAARSMARGFVEGFNAADASKISCRSLVKASEEEAKQEDGENQYRLVGGYDQLAEMLARSVKPPSRIELSTVVRSVEWKRGEVMVTAIVGDRQKVFRATKAIIALPLGVLQTKADEAGGVAFEPELPTRAAINDLLAMGPVVKLSIRFREPFWEALGFKDLSFIHRPDAPFPTLWSTLPLRTPLLTLWAGGPAAEALMGRGDLKAAAVESLAMVFSISSQRVAAQIEKIDHHDWTNDPFARGAYSYAKVGGADVPEMLAKPIVGTLFFAGEHTHGGLLGTVAGAIHSGKRAAKAILSRR